MLSIIVPGREFYDPKSERFYTIKETHLTLEHSLVSISKWESKWKKSFFTFFTTQKNLRKTTPEFIDYVRCMTLTQNVNPIIYKALSNENYQRIIQYMNDPMTATTFREDNKKPPSRKKITSEEIYYQMIMLGVPFECQKWHFNRLITLIRVCQEKSKGQNGKKKITSDMYRARSDLNDARRAALRSKG